MWRVQEASASQCTHVRQSAISSELAHGAFLHLKECRNVGRGEGLLILQPFLGLSVGREKPS